MDVEIDDCHPLETTVERGLRRQRDVVEEAEAHRVLPGGVVPGRARETERGVVLASKNGLDRRGRSTS